MSAEPLLLVDNVAKHFALGGAGWRKQGKVYAVDGVSFSLKAGETLGLVGESGCGKSTLGRLILRLYPLTAGKIVFRGQDLTHLSARALRPIRKHLQVIFQDPFSSLNPRMRVGSILAEPLLIHGLGGKKEREARVSELLDLVGLGAEARERYPHEFSGGQRQRIGIARALALDPQLIIADEPVSALDVSIRSQILNLLVDLREKLGLSYLFVSHDLAVIEHISDQVAVMYLGRIVELAASTQLYAKPQHPYTQALIAAIPQPVVGEQGSLRKKREKPLLHGDVPSPLAPPSGCHFHPRCPLATAQCRQVPPQLRNVGSEAKPHWVACHVV